MENKYTKINRKKKDKLTIPNDKFTIKGDKFTMTGDKYRMTGDKYKMAGDKYTVTADVSNILKAINENMCWKSSSTKLCKNSMLTTKTLVNQEKPQAIKQQNDLQSLFNMSKPCLKTQPPYNQAQCHLKDFVSTIKFLKLQDQYDRLLTGLVKKSYVDQDLISRLFQHQKQDMTIAFKRDYLVGKKVGEGAYATVRLAIYKATNLKVAIKVYQKDKIKQIQRRKSLRRQIQILQMLNHPNIVQIFDVVQTNNHVNIIMQYVPGISLSSWLKSQAQSKCTASTCKSIIRYLASSLSYLHSRSISHRDIKLQNIILSEDLIPKLIDFGFSTCVERKIKLFCGTPSYMAPEIVQKIQYKGEQADVWALGVLFYVIITGNFPFKGATDEELYRKINKADYNKSQTLFSHEVSDLLGKMLTVNPNQRITAAQILNHSWLKQTNLMLKKTKRVQSSYDYNKKASSHKSNDKTSSNILTIKRMNQTCKQNLKTSIRLSRQSPRTPNKSGLQRKIAKQASKILTDKIIPIQIRKKQPLTKFYKANRILQILQGQTRKKTLQEKSKSKTRRI